MSDTRTSYGSRTVRRVLPVVLLASLVAMSAVAVGAITVGAVAGDGGAPGDAPDERPSARQIDAGETIEANLSSGDDVDWYAVDATAGDAVVAKLALLNATENQSVEINVYDSAGDPVTETERDKMSGPQRVAGERPGSTRELTAEAPDVAETTGPYYVEVRESRWNETAAGVSTPYNLTVTTEALDGYDPNENGSTATPIDLGGSIEGVVAPYDHDVYAVTLTEGQNYTVTFNHTGERSDRFSKSIALYTDASNVTDDDPEGGRQLSEFTDDTSVTFTAEESGTHYLRLGQSGVTAQLLERDGYRLTITPTGSATDGGTDGDDDPAGDGTASPDDDTETTLTESPETPAGDGSGDGATPENETPTDGGDTPPTETETTTESEPNATTTGGGGGGGTTPTPSPTDDGGPGFGVGVALLGLLGAARLAHRRSR